MSRWLAAAAAGIAAVILAGAALAVYAARYEGRILPGVTVAGEDVGGLSPESVLDPSAAWRAVVPDTIVLRDPGDPEDPADDREWSFPREELGLAVPAREVADAAYRAGRDGLPLLAPLWLRLRGRELVPVVQVDLERAKETLEGLVPLVDEPPVSADVREGGGALVVTGPVYGRQLSVEDTLTRISEVGRDPTVRTIDVVTSGTAPRFSDAQSVADAYDLAVSGPVRLTWRQGQAFTADVERVRRWFSLDRRPSPAGDEVPALVVDEGAIARWLETLAPAIERPPRAARLSYDLLTGRLTVRQSEVSGQKLDVAASIRRVVDAAYTDVRTGELAVREERTPEAESIVRQLAGKVRVLASAATRVDGQPPGRVRNMLLAVAELDGIVLPPGAELSILQELGTVSSEAGYDMVHVESGPEGVLLGGLEQVATGAFRAAVWTGLPITERHAPPSRLVWAEPPIGLDAALSTSGRDLRILNDTQGHLILQLRIDAAQGALVASVVGAPPERDVELVGPIVTDTVAALAPEGRDDGRLAPGEEVQVAWARDGATVAYQRIVRSGGVEVLRDAIVSEYAPSGIVVIVNGEP